MSPMIRRHASATFPTAAGLALVLLASCGGDAGSGSTSGSAPASTSTRAGTDGAPSPPELETAEMEPLVREMLDARRAQVLAQPGEARAWAALGFALDAHFLLEEGEACLAEAVRLDPELFEAAYDYAFLGTLLPRNVDEVCARFERAEALKGDYPAMFARHGDYLLEAGRAEDAEACFRKALDLFGAYGYAQLGLGRARLDRDDSAAAIKLLSQVHRAYPADAAAATAYAQALTLAGRVEEAAAVMETQGKAKGGSVPVQDPLRGEILGLARNASSNYKRGDQKFRRGDLAAAAIEFERVLTADASNRTARLMLARTYVGLRRLDEARVHLNAALESEPADPDAHAMLGQLDAEAGQHGAAIEHFLRASERGRLDDMSYYAWASSLGAEKRWDEVLVRVDEWAGHYPGAPRPPYLRALGLFNAGRQDEARAALADAIAAHPGEPLRAQVESLVPQ